MALHNYMESLNEKIKKYTKRVLKYERRLQRTREGFRGLIRNTGHSLEKKRETNRDPKYQFLIAVLNLIFFSSSLQSINLLFI
jgi:hypothetical protein